MVMRNVIKRTRKKLDKMFEAANSTYTATTLPPDLFSLTGESRVDT